MRAALLVFLTGCGGATLLIDDADRIGAPGGVTHPDDTDAGPPVDPDPTDTSPEPAGPAPDFSRPGPYAVDTDGGRFDASCSMAYTTFLPVGHEPVALVVLAHGFLRSREYLAGHGENLASWGLAVVTPDLCHLSIVDVDYPQNARDLTDLGAELARGRPVVHAGHSAGGLSSFLAAGIDPGCIGHVGLDLADFDGLGAEAAPDLPVPSWELLAEPEVCNDFSSSLDAFAVVPDLRALKVDGADHCDFESPTDWGCQIACADGSGDDELVTDAVMGLLTAAALALSGENPRGAEYWTPGEVAHDGLVADGVVSEP